MTKRKWLIFGVVSAVSLFLLFSSFYVHNFVYSLIATAFMFAPVFVSIAFQDDSRRKP